MPPDPTTIARPDGIHYDVEELPGGRGQLHATVVLDGRADHDYRIGVPAPVATVKAAAEHLSRYPTRGAAERT